MELYPPSLCPYEGIEVYIKHMLHVCLEASWDRMGWWLARVYLTSLQASIDPAIFSLARLSLAACTACISRGTWVRLPWLCVYPLPYYISCDEARYLLPFSSKARMYNSPHVDISHQTRSKPIHMAQYETVGSCADLAAHSFPQSSM